MKTLATGKSRIGKHLGAALQKNVQKNSCIRDRSESFCGLYHRTGFVSGPIASKGLAASYRGHLLQRPTTKGRKGSAK